MLLDPARPGVVTGHNLYDGMCYPPATYLVRKDRDWLMLTPAMTDLSGHGRRRRILLPLRCPSATLAP